MEDLKKAIIKAVPEIVDLKFGCEIGCEAGYFVLDSQYTIEYTYKGTEHEVRYLDDKHDYHKNLEDIDFKIIGRPITLADVLIALNKDREKECHYMVDTRGIFVECSGHTVIMSRERWNLKETLDGQSPECIEFLKKLLVK